MWLVGQSKDPKSTKVQSNFTARRKHNKLTTRRIENDTTVNSPNGYWKHATIWTDQTTVPDYPRLISWLTKVFNLESVFLVHTWLPFSHLQFLYVTQNEQLQTLYKTIYKDGLSWTALWKSLKTIVIASDLIMTFPSLKGLRSVVDLRTVARESTFQWKENISGLCWIVWALILVNKAQRDIPIFGNRTPANNADPQPS